MLPGSTTKVLQEIMELNTTLNACLKQEERLVVPYGVPFSHIPVRPRGALTVMILYMYHS